MKVNNNSDHNPPGAASNNLPLTPSFTGIGSMGQFLLMVSMSVAIIRFIRLVEGPFKDFGQNY